MKRTLVFVFNGFVILLLNCVSTAVAQVPSGQFSYAFTNTPLWDASGIYTNNTDTNDVVISEIQHQANGKITGVRTETYVNGADHAEGSGPVTGTTFVKAGVVGGSLKVKEGITGVSGGVAYTANASIKETATIVPSSLMVFETGSVRLCVVHGKCLTQTEGFSLP
jgi:hypothetical protein